MSQEQSKINSSISKFKKVLITSASESHIEIYKYLKYLLYGRIIYCVCKLSYVFVVRQVYRMYVPTYVVRQNYKMYPLNGMIIWCISCTVGLSDVSVKQQNFQMFMLYARFILRIW